ncbi:MAG TPA: RNA polymerase sigma factor [Streptosporangiaceae bacterium]
MPILGIVIGEKFERLLAAAQRRTDQGRPDQRRTGKGHPDLGGPDLGGPDLGRPDLGAADEADRAFSELWRDANPALLRYLRVIAPETAEDIAADTWVQVVRGLGAFRGDEAAWRAWLFTIARHRAIDEGRRRSRRPVVSVPEVADVTSPDNPDPADLVLEKLSTRAAVALIATLPRLQAEVILLRVVAGLDTPTVARLVGRSPGAVRVAAHRGLRQLAATLAEAGVTHGSAP